MQRIIKGGLLICNQKRAYQVEIKSQVEFNICSTSDGRADLTEDVRRRATLI